jgi:hypothetical protein
MARYVETLFRYWIRFAVLLILLPVPASIATLVYFRTVQATTNLWVQDPTYFGANVTSNGVSGWNQYLTPAQNETDLLAQYLQTDSFISAIGDELARSGLDDNSERRELVRAIPKNMHVVSSGSHLVTITFSCDIPSRCAAVLSATIAVFEGRLVDALKAQEQLSTTFLKSQLVAAQQRSDDSQAALQKYMTSHPGAPIALAGQQSGYPELDRLVTQAQQDRDQVTQLQNQLAQAEFTFAAADRFIQTNTKVVDQPRITAGGLIGDGSSVKRAAVVWLAAIGIAAVYLVLLVLTDKTARDTKELASRMAVPVLATVPRLSAKELS